MISDRTAKIAGHVSSMTTYYSHFEIADFSQYPEYLIDQVAGFFEKQKQKAAFLTLYSKQKRGDTEQIWCDF